MFLADQEKLILWGARDILIDDKQAKFPKACRKRVPSCILRFCKKLEINKIGDRSFLKLVNPLTCNDMHTACAVDHAT